MDKIKKYLEWVTTIAVACLSFILVSCGDGSHSSNIIKNTNIPADTTGMSSDAKSIIKKIYVGWNLGNTLESTGGETAWGNPATTQAIIDMVKKAGFNAVRIPCAWSSHLSDASTYAINRTWLLRVKRVVDYAINDGMYVIINIHKDQGWLEDNVTITNKVAVNAEQKALWTQIATYFRGYDEHLMFACCNEPSVSDAIGMGVLLSYEQTFINAVRATGGRNYYRNLIIQGPAADVDKTNTMMTTLPTDVVSNRMIAEVHYYTPWQFCGLTADADWGNMCYYWGTYANQPNVNGINRNANWQGEDYMITEFAKVEAQFVNKGIPAIIGEFGATRRTMGTTTDQAANDNSVAEFLEDVTKNAKNAGCAPFVWDDGGDFVLFNRTALTVRYPLFLQSIMEGAKIGSYPF
jgi:endoglucanase